MTIGLGSDIHDPLDMSRRLIFDAARKAARYFDMVNELIDMRDDDAARAMAATGISQVKAMSAAFAALAAGRASSPARDAAAFFDRSGDLP